MPDQINVGSLVARLELETAQLEQNSRTAQAALDRIRQQMREVQVAMKSGSLSAAEFASQTEELSAAQNRLQAAMINASAAVQAQMQAMAYAASTSDLAHQSQMEAIAIEHEIAMLKHQESQIVAVATAKKEAEAANLVQQVEMETIAIEHEIAMLKHEEAQIVSLVAAKKESEAVSLAHQSEMQAAAIEHEVEMLKHQEAQLIALASAKKEADAATLAHQAEMESAAVEHEIATLKHEESQIRKVEAAKKEADAANLVHQSEMQSAAIEHEIAMLKHEEAQIRQVEAAKKEALAADLAHQAEMESMAIQHEIDMLKHQEQQIKAVMAAKMAAQAARAAGGDYQAQQMYGEAAGIASAEIAAKQAQAAKSAAESMKVAARESDEALKKTEHRSRMAGIAMMQFGYAVDDIQYGFRGIVNNVGPFTYSMAAAAGATTAWASGIGAAVQIAAVAVYQFYTHWDMLMDGMGMGRTLSEAEEMKELGKNTEKTAAETEKLNKYKKEQHQIDEMMNRESKKHKEFTKDLKEATAEGDPHSVVGGLAHVLESTGRGAKMTPDEIEKELGPLRKPVESGERTGLKGPLFEKYKKMLEEKKKDLERRMSEETADMAKERVRAAENDNTKNKDHLRALLNDVKSHPGAFPAGYAKDLEDKLPENSKQQEGWEAQGKANAKKLEAKQRKIDSDLDKAENDKETNEKKKIDKMSEQLLSGRSFVDALKGKMDVDKIQTRLQELGHSPEDAWRLAPKVAEKNKTEIDERTAKYAAEHDMGIDQAKQAMATDAEEKFSRDSMRRAEDVAPGIDKFAKDRVAGGMAGGEDIRSVMADIKSVLRAMDARDGKQDLSEEQITAASGEIIDKASKDINSQVADEMMNPSDQDKKRQQSKSEQFSAADLATRVQGGVNNGQEQEQKKTNSYLDQMVKLMANGQKAGGNPFVVR